MCHFYGNPLSWLCDDAIGDNLPELIQSYHLEAIRTLPSFQRTVERLVEIRQLARARALLEDNDALTVEIEKSLESSRHSITRLLRAMSLLSRSSPEPIDKIELYMTTFQGGLAESNFVKVVLDSIKRMTLDDMVHFVKSLRDCIETGTPEMDLAGWADEDDKFLDEIGDIHSKVSALAEDAVETGKPARSSYAIQSNGVRTTVIAQRVQLSYEKSTLNEKDKEFTALVDRLTSNLIEYFSMGSPQNTFLNEAWLYDSTSPYRNVFTPRPRGAIELALSAPYHYLNCECCESVEGLSSTHPATAILYQMYLETGSLINIFDLWSAFFEMIGGGEEQKCDERDALVLFYRALADLMSLGMVKQSKKKADHLAKVTWKGL
jgi:origin recognition complex subunit 3